jgi:hypothetical protein
MFGNNWTQKIFVSLLTFCILSSVLIPNRVFAADSKLTITAVVVDQKAAQTDVIVKIIAGWQNPPNGTIIEQTLKQNGSVLYHNVGERVTNPKPSNFPEEWGTSVKTSGTYQYQLVYVVETGIWPFKKKTTYTTNTFTKQITVGTPVATQTFNIKNTSDGAKWWSDTCKDGIPVFADTLDPKEVGYMILGAKQILSGATFDPENMAKEMKTGSGTKTICGKSAFDATDYFKSNLARLVDFYTKHGGTDPAVIAAYNAAVQRATEAFQAAAKEDYVVPIGGGTTGIKMCDSFTNRGLTGKVANIWNTIIDPLGAFICALMQGVGDAVNWLMNSDSGLGNSTNPDIPWGNTANVPVNDVFQLNHPK